MVAVWALATDRQVRHDFKLRHYRLPRLRAVVSSVSTGCRQCVHYQWISAASRMLPVGLFSVAAVSIARWAIERRLDWFNSAHGAITIVNLTIDRDLGEIRCAQ
jgi:hypothetical protein